MTVNELANLLDSVDLTDAVVIHDTGDVLYAVKTFEPMAPLFFYETRFVFYISKDMTERIGIIEDMGDDLFVYVKPQYRGHKYTETAMREIVPYLFPAIYSVTSAFDWQDDKIEWLAKQANMTVRFNKRWDGYEFQDHRNKMDARKQDILRKSAYARALQNVEQNPNALRAFPEIVANPMRFTNNIAYNPNVNKMQSSNKGCMDYTNGVLTLPYFCNALSNDKSPDVIHLMLCDISEVNAYCEDGKNYIEYNMRDVVTIDETSKGYAFIDFVRVSAGDDGLYCMINARSNDEARELFEKIALHANHCDNMIAYFSWGSVTLEDYELGILWNREFSQNEASAVIKKYNLSVEDL